VTPVYRAPELFWPNLPEVSRDPILYTNSIDIWSSGCIMAEMFRGRPIFYGETELDIVHSITM